MQAESDRKSPNAVRPCIQINGDARPTPRTRSKNRKDPAVPSNNHPRIERRNTTTVIRRAIPRMYRRRGTGPLRSTHSQRVQSDCRLGEATERETPNDNQGEERRTQVTHGDHVADDRMPLKTRCGVPRKEATPSQRRLHHGKQNERRSPLRDRSRTSL